MPVHLSSLTSALLALDHLTNLVLALGLTGTLPIAWATGFPNLQVGPCSLPPENPHGLLPSNKIASPAGVESCGQPPCRPTPSHLDPGALSLPQVPYPFASFSDLPAYLNKLLTK